MKQDTIVARLQRSVRKYGWKGFYNRALQQGINAFTRNFRRWRDHHGKHVVHGDPKGLDIGIVILAGYKPALWPLTLERIRRYAPPAADVCVATPGKYVTELATLCANNGWTYLTTSANKTGLALNKAIEAHPAATRWFKLDEDVFVGKDFFEDLIAGYDALRESGSYLPGFCAPMLNVNGVSYAGFLEQAGTKELYAQAFGEVRQASDGVHAHYDSAAAEWLWRHTLPFDETAAKVRTAPGTAIEHARLIGTRFSIGAIYLERDFWHQIGGFGSSVRAGILGVDETALCTECILASRPMFYLTNVLAGHFSFYPQERAMMNLLPEFAVLDPATFGDTARGDT